MSISTNQTPAARPWLTISEAAERLGLAERTIRRLISDGELPARRIGTRIVRIAAADVDTLGRPVAPVRGR